MPNIRISNGRIEDIMRERDTTFVTVTYRDGRNNRGREERVRLVVRPRTVIVDENGNSVRVSTLRVGMLINATISSAMTRSIPPQATAYFIQIVRRDRDRNIVIGRILDINRNNRNFTTISDNNFNSIIRFNLADNARILDRAGRPVGFGRLLPTMLVQVRHADFMTASIPPQTTAFEVRIL